MRQFVEVMTKDLFQGGEDGMLTGQADLQRDTLTDTLAEHLVESGTFGIADLLMRQWAQQGRVPSDAPATATPPSTHPPSDRPSQRLRLRSTGDQTVPLAKGDSPGRAERSDGGLGGGYSQSGAHSERGGVVRLSRPAPPALSMDDALRLYPPAKARPLSIDHSPSPSSDTAP